MNYVRSLVLFWLAAARLSVANVSDPHLINALNGIETAGREIIAAIHAESVKTGKVPESLTSLVPDYFLHLPFSDGVSPLGSWLYTKEVSDDNTWILGQHFFLEDPKQDYILLYRSDADYPSRFSYWRFLETHNGWGLYGVFSEDPPKSN